MLLCLDIMKLAQSADLVRMVDLVVCIYPKSMRAHSKLAEGNLESVTCYPYIRMGMS